MSKVYDNWERLVGAVLKKEELRRIALCDSFSSSISADFSSRFSFDSSHEDVPDFSSRFSFDFGDVPAGLDRQMDQAGSTNWYVGLQPMIDVTPDSTNSGETFNPSDPSSQSIFFFRDVMAIEFEEIKKATKNFQPDMLLGEGGFGPVFKGWIHEHFLTAVKPGSGIAVAVKNMRKEAFQGHREWSKEINYLSQLRHPNLVKLIGYCSEEDNLILVYEFMPKGSLDNHLFRRGHLSLSWATRIKVAIGAARGLSFLHDLAIPVIHRGFKSGDILLDGEFNAKLSDFGLARDGPTGDMTHVSTQVVGTLGYAAPEYIATGHLTTKCDVYGFGVVLLELLSGRRVYDRNRASKEQNLVEWAKPYLGDKRKLLQIMDTRLEGQYPRKEAYTVAKLALKCLNSLPKQRPRMAEVVVALERL